MLVGSSLSGTVGSSRKAFDTPNISLLENIIIVTQRPPGRGSEPSQVPPEPGWVRLSGGGGGVVVRSWTRTLALGGSSRRRVKRVRPRPSARLVLMSLTAGAWHTELPQRARYAPDKDRPVCWDVILHNDDNDDDVVLVSFARSTPVWLRKTEKKRERWWDKVNDFWTKTNIHYYIIMLYMYVCGVHPQGATDVVYDAAIAVGF